MLACYKQLCTIWLHRTIKCLLGSGRIDANLLDGRSSKRQKNYIIWSGLINKWCDLCDHREKEPSAVRSHSDLHVNVFCSYCLLYFLNVSSSWPRPTRITRVIKKKYFLFWNSSPVGAHRLLESQLNSLFFFLFVKTGQRFHSSNLLILLSSVTRVMIAVLFSSHRVFSIFVFFFFILHLWPRLFLYTLIFTATSAEVLVFLVSMAAEARGGLFNLCDLFDEMISWPCVFSVVFVAVITCSMTTDFFPTTVALLTQLHLI